MKVERSQMDSEERERKMLEEQIARARAQQADQPDLTVGLQKKEGEKIKLNLFGASEPKAEEGKEEESASAPAEIKTTIGFGKLSAPGAAKPLAISTNPLKRPAPVNVFKSSKAAKTDSTGSPVNGDGNGAPKYKSEAERLMMEDQDRKASRGQGHGPGYRGFGPSRGGR